MTIQVLNYQLEIRVRKLIRRKRRTPRVATDPAISAALVAGASTLACACAQIGGAL